MKIDLLQTKCAVGHRGSSCRRVIVAFAILIQYFWRPLQHGRPVRHVIVASLKHSNAVPLMKLSD